MTHSVRSRLPSRSRRRDTKGGYTAVEVLMAMTVMAIGGAAVMSMQKATLQGNLDARKTDLANSIARTWVERLERDSMQWTLPNGGANTTSNIANAKLLNVTGNWFFPAAYIGGTTPETMSPGFDILGRDLPGDAKTVKNAQFCTNVRLTWLVTNELMRADVRVLWPVGILNQPPGASGTGDTTWCSSANAVLADPNDPANSGNAQVTYHAVYLTTTIKENATP
jgi:Tfp pilus assembly protein PilV